MNPAAEPMARSAPAWRPIVACAVTLATGLLAWGWLGGMQAPGAHAWVYAAFAGCGLVSGFLSGLLGIGGALVVVPAMVVLLPWLGVPAVQVPHVAVASSLAAMVPSACAAALAQHRKGALDPGWLRRLGPGMAAGSVCGALFALALSGTALSLLFAGQSLYYGWGLMRAAPPPGGWRSRLACGLCRLPAWAVGPAVAAFCSCAGMGGGSLTVPYLLGRGESLVRSVAASSALNLCIALGGVLTFLLTHPRGASGEPALVVCWPAALLVGSFAVLAVPRGVALAHRLPVALFRRLLGAVTLFGAAVLVLRTVLAAA